MGLGLIHKRGLADFLRGEIVNDCPPWISVQSSLLLQVPSEYFSFQSFMDFQLVKCQLVKVLQNAESFSRSLSHPTSPQAQIISTSFHILSSLLASFICFFVFFTFCCLNVQVFWTMLVEVHISYSYTEWYSYFI